VTYFAGSVVNLLTHNGFRRIEFLGRGDELLTTVILGQLSDAVLA
jgi:hypothetical protein